MNWVRCGSHLILGKLLILKFYILVILNLCRKFCHSLVDGYEVAVCATDELLLNSICLCRFLYRSRGGHAQYRGQLVALGCGSWHISICGLSRPGM